jgi:hypothetical protein
MPEVFHHRVEGDPAGRGHHGNQAPRDHQWEKRTRRSIPTGIPFWLLHDRQLTGRPDLPIVLIETPDEHSTAVPIEPGLNTIPHMSRSIDSGVLIMRDAMLLPADVPYQIGATLHRLHLAHQ